MNISRTAEPSRLHSHACHLHYIQLHACQMQLHYTIHNCMPIKGIDMQLQAVACLSSAFTCSYIRLHACQMHLHTVTCMSSPAVVCLQDHCWSYILRNWHLLQRTPTYKASIPLDQRQRLAADVKQSLSAITKLDSPGEQSQSMGFSVLWDASNTQPEAAALTPDGKRPVSKATEKRRQRLAEEQQRQRQEEEKRVLQQRRQQTVREIRQRQAAAAEAAGRAAPSSAVRSEGENEPSKRGVQEQRQVGVGRRAGDGQPPNQARAAGQQPLQARAAGQQPNQARAASQQQPNQATTAGQQPLQARAAGGQQPLQARAGSRAGHHGSSQAPSAALPATSRRPTPSTNTKDTGDTHASGKLHPRADHTPGLRSGGRSGPSVQTTPQSGRSSACHESRQPTSTHPRADFRLAGQHRPAAATGMHQGTVRVPQPIGHPSHPTLEADLQGRGQQQLQLQRPSAGAAGNAVCLPTSDE